MKKLQDLRKDYGKDSLDVGGILPDPFDQFEVWMSAAIAEEGDEANAMVLSTVDSLGQPSSRVVLLRSLDKGLGLGFFTNYTSRKAVELDVNPQASILFFWKTLQRQVRIEGEVTKAPQQVSDDYFSGRPRESKIGAWSSPQSAVIPNRHALDQIVKHYTGQFDGRDVPRPSFWGGYFLKPRRFEFWQGRPSRLHDRIEYKQMVGTWKMKRLAP